MRNLKLRQMITSNLSKKIKIILITTIKTHSTLYTFNPLRDSNETFRQDALYNGSFLFICHSLSSPYKGTRLTYSKIISMEEEDEHS
jgi:hypothetical protein